MRWRKRITYCDLICSIASVSRVVGMHYTQSGSPWSRAICHYACHPPGRTVGQKTRPSGRRSLVRSSARDERSFIIHQVRPTVRAMGGVYKYSVLVYREKLDVSRREFRKLSFRLRKHTYARSLRERVALHCLSHFAIESIYFLSFSRGWSSNVRATLSFVRVISAIPSGTWMIPREIR